LAKSLLAVGDAYAEHEVYFAGGELELAGEGGGVGDEEGAEFGGLAVDGGAEGGAVHVGDEFALHLAGGNKELNGHDPVEDTDGPGASVSVWSNELIHAQAAVVFGVDGGGVVAPGVRSSRVLL